MEVTLDFKEILGKVKLVFRKPDLFFGKYKKEKGWKTALIYFAILTLVGSVFTLVYGLSIYPLIKPQLDVWFGSTGASTFTLAEVLPAAISSYLTGIMFSFVIGFAFKYCLKLFGAKGTFSEAYQLIVYSRTPVYLLSWFPVVNLVALIYSLVLLYKGVREYYAFSKVRSILTIIVSVLVMIVASILIFLVLFNYS